MKLKSALALIVAMSTLMIGCSNDISTQDSKIADEVTKQKNMTKVQNNVNEIMDKDYEYILKNMGTPYCITYYIDKDKISNLEDINQSSDMRLVYPKYISKEKLEGSALYIDLIKDRVTEVQTYEFDTENLKKNTTSNDIDIVFDIYVNKGIVDIDDIRDIDWDKYIGQNKDTLQEATNNKMANINVYSKSKDQDIEIYLIENQDKNINDVLAVTTSDEIIKDIKVVDKKQTIDIVKSYISQF